MNTSGNIGLVAIIIIVTVFFCLNLYNTLSLIRPENRKLHPAAVWLLFVPLFNFVWNFFVVIAVSSSLRNELEDRNFDVTERPGLVSGMIYSVISFLVGSAPYILMAAGIEVLSTEELTKISEGHVSSGQGLIIATGILGLLQLIFFIQYWMKISWYKNILKKDNIGED